MAEQPKYFDIEDYETGKKYRVEAYEPDVTYDEALEYFSALPEEEWSQFEVATAAPAAAPKQQSNQASAPAPDFNTDESMAQVLDEARQATRGDVWEKQNKSGAQRMTPSMSSGRDDVDQYINQLFYQGVRDPAKINAEVTRQFPEVSFRPLTQTDIVSAQKLAAEYKAAGFSGRPVFAGAAEYVDVPPPEAPDSLSGAFGSSAVRSGLQMANTIVGLGSLAAEAVGAQETADSWLEEYIEADAAIAFNNPQAIGSYTNIDTVGDAAMYGAETLGELAPQLATMFGGGAVGKKVADVVIRRSVARRVDDLVSQGVSQQVAENLVTQTLVRQARNRGVAAGTTATSIGQESGATFANTYQETGEKAPWLSLAAGVASGSLDSIIPLRFFKNLGLADGEIRRGIGGGIRRALQEGAIAVPAEGFTEVLQEMITNIPTSVITGESLFTEQKLEEYTNAFLKGAIGGSSIAVATAGAQQGSTGPYTVPIQNLEQTITVPVGRKNSKAYRQGLSDATQAVQARLDETTGQWENAPTTVALPNFKQTRFDNDALGVYGSDGTVYMNTEAVIAEANELGVTPDTVVQSVLFHEALGHYGLSQLYGDGLDAKLSDFYYRGAPEFRAMVDNWIQNNPGAYLDSNGQVDPVRAAEEVLAEMAGEGEMPRSIVDELINFVKDLMRQMGMQDWARLNYSEREIRTILAKGQDKVRRGGRVNPVTGQTVDKFIYIGQNAANGEKIRRDISNELMVMGDTPYSEKSLGLIKLEYGKMKRMGFSDEELYETFGPGSIGRKADGWFIGKDGKWRLEISDSTSDADFYDLEFENRIDPSYTENLEDVLYHPTLFEAYPILKTVQVSTGTDYAAGQNTMGYFDMSGDVPLIYINPDPRNNKHATLLHEIQHAVQALESFAYGGDSTTAIDSLPETVLMKGAKQLSKNYKREAEDALEMYRGYLDIKDDPRALEVKIIADQMKQYAMDGYDLSHTVMRELQQDFDSLMDSLEGDLQDQGVFTQSKIEDILEGLYDPDRASLIEENARDAVDAYEAITLSIQANDYQSIREIASGDPQAKYEAYAHLLGEYEARDVEARMYMNERMLRETEPLTSEPEIDPDSLVATDVYGSPLAASEQAPDKFARRTQPKKTLEDLSGDDLIRSLDSIGLLEEVTSSYVPTTLGLDELLQEAQLREVPPSVIQKMAYTDPGEFSRKLFMLDVANTKIRDKLVALNKKIETGNYSLRDKEEFIAATLASKDITARILGLQSEVGRALRVARDMATNHSKMNRTLREAFEGLDDEGLAGLDDPATFERFARRATVELEQKVQQSSLGETVLGVINTPRTLMSSFDLSAPLRQGIYFISRPEYYKSLAKMFELAGSKDGRKLYDQMMRDIQRSENYGLMTAGKLFMSSVDGATGTREEAFAGTLVDNMPGIEWSAVTYSGFLNKLRTDLFNSFITDLEKNGWNFKQHPDGSPKALNELSESEIKLLQSLAGFINAGTGRGNLSFTVLGRKIDLIQRASGVLNAMFFSPGLVASRLRLVNPLFYASLPGPVRKMALKEASKFAGIAAGVLGSLNYFLGLAINEEDEEDRVTIEMDPRSSDFLKLRVDDRRYDVLGGMAQYMTFFSKLFAHAVSMHEDIDMAYKKDSRGEYLKYNEDFRDTSFLDEAMKFTRYKLSPIASYIIDAMEGKNAVGEEFTFAGGIADRLTPLYLQDLFEMAEDPMDPSASEIALALPGFFGVGIGRYTPLPLDTEQVLEVPTKLDVKEYPEMDNDFLTISEGELRLKAPGERLWHKTLNGVFREIMEEQIRHPDWVRIDDSRKADVIDAAKREARKRTKELMIGLPSDYDEPTMEEQIEELDSM